MGTGERCGGCEESGVEVGMAVVVSDRGVGSKDIFLQCGFEGYRGLKRSCLGNLQQHRIRWLWLSGGCG